MMCKEIFHETTASDRILMAMKENNPDTRGALLKAIDADFYNTKKNVTINGIPTRGAGRPSLSPLVIARILMDFLRSPYTTKLH
jgi:hypothetical protein